MSAPTEQVVDDEDFAQIRAQVREFVREAVVPREREIAESDAIPDDIRAQAERLAPQAAAAIGAGVDVVACSSQIGSGALPTNTLPSAALRLPGALAGPLRRGRNHSNDPARDWNRARPAQRSSAPPVNV